uniref:Uncharacterized protein LOC114342273 isoform X3 n=1 Tax=Diabrotica virgifera virgifera TaxID=50390 RepID=A0A6P7GYK5_DIAVI
MQVYKKFFISKPIKWLCVLSIVINGPLMLIQVYRAINIPEEQAIRKYGCHTMFYLMAIVYPIIRLVWARYTEDAFRMKNVTFLSFDTSSTKVKHAVLKDAKSIIYKYKIISSLIGVSYVIIGLEGFRLYQVDFIHKCLGQLVDKQYIGLYFWARKESVTWLFGFCLILIFIFTAELVEKLESEDNRILQNFNLLPWYTFNRENRQNYLFILVNHTKTFLLSPIPALPANRKLIFMYFGLFYRILAILIDIN